jgi:hypothetical protein
MTTTRTPQQIALARATLAQIEAHPEQWKQSDWRCDTGMCFAGWAATIAGRQWVDPDAESEDEYLRAAPGDDPDRIRAGENGEPIIHVQSAARTLLGLDYDEARVLFGSTNTLKHLHAYVDRLASGDYLDYDFVDALLDSDDFDGNNVRDEGPF